MTDFLTLLESQSTEQQSFPPGLNKYMDIIKEFDSSLQYITFVLDGDTVKKSKFSYTIAVKDVIKTIESRVSIFEDIKKFNETLDSNYDLTRLAMSENIRKNIRPKHYTILNVDVEESEFYGYKNGKIIKYHKFVNYNIRKKSTS